MKRRLYGSLWLLVYFAKWPIFIGIPLLYFMTAFESNLVMNSVWFIAFTAIFWDMIRRFTNA